MRILFIGTPLYGLLYPLISLAQAYRVQGHEVVIASAGKFAQKAAEAGLVSYDATPDLDSEANYKKGEDERKKAKLGTKPGRFSFFSDEMTDGLVAFTHTWQPGLIIYPPLGVVGPLLAAKFNIPSVLQTVGFMHGPRQVHAVSRSMEEACVRHGVTKMVPANAWIDVAPPSMTTLENEGEPILPMQYVPYNGGGVWQEWWQRTPGRKRLLVSLGTLKPMADGLDLIDWVMDKANELDAEIILQLGLNAREGLRALPDNVRLVEWLSTGLFLNGADGFIHHGGAGNTLTALHAGIPQIVFGEGADRPFNANAVVTRGCGIIPGEQGLSTALINDFLANNTLRQASLEVATEMASQPTPADVVSLIAAQLKLPHAH